jgi:hypothetical protein
MRHGRDARAWPPSAFSSFAYSAFSRANMVLMSPTVTASAPLSRRKLDSACTRACGQCSVIMPDEVGPPNGAARRSARAPR